MLGLLAKYKVIFATAALLGALGVGAGGVAAANGALPAALGAFHTTANTVGLAVDHAKHGRHGMLGGLIHGSVITKVNGAYVTYTVDAGQVTAASTSSLTLKRADGQKVTLTITANTAWGVRHAAPKDPSKLVGRRIVVFSQNGTAMQIGRGNGVVKDIVHADLTFYRNGKTHTVQIDRGSVQSLSATQISVKRADGVVVTEPVAAKARWVQAPGHKTIQPSQVTSGETVTILTVGGQVTAVRVGSVSQSGASSI